MQELFDLWRATAPDAVNISGDFSPKEFAAALNHLKPGKAPGPDPICPELLIHAGPGLKLWLCGFLSSCLCQFKIQKVWRRALVAVSSQFLWSCYSEPSPMFSYHMQQKLFRKLC